MNLIKLIKRNKLLPKLAKISFFLGLNIVLGFYFYKNNKSDLSPSLHRVLNLTGLVQNSEPVFFKLEPDKKIDQTLDPQLILKKLNLERKSFGVGELRYNNTLATAAASLIKEVEKYDYNLDKQNFLPELKTALKNAKYNYSHVSHNILIGPMSEQAVVDAWFSDDKQIVAIKDEDFIEVGFATKIVKLKDIGVVGVVVQVLGKPTSKNPQTIKTPTVAVKKKIQFPIISDEEVFNALNSYRIVHKVQPLSIDQNLCNYASKRVKDLIKFGGLDEHAGFKKDFADLTNLPEPIRNYSGDSIAENLAYQYCKNMTTGDSFVAQTGTAIIEWCFDSSTKGHREAQLSKDYSNVCIKHGNNMYVVIFGN